MALYISVHTPYCILIRLYWLHLRTLMLLHVCILLYILLWFWIFELEILPIFIYIFNTFLIK